MKANPDKKIESVQQSEPTEKTSGGESRFDDNRPETTQLRAIQTLANRFVSSANPIQKKNNTGLPDALKSGVENLSGHSMDDVKVHYNSPKPAQLNAHAYAQGTDIHVASGQEKHLPHEAWHVVQQKQGRVKPTKQLKAKVNINDDQTLENEADVMGAKAARTSESTAVELKQVGPISTSTVLRVNGNGEGGDDKKDDEKVDKKEKSTEEIVDKDESEDKGDAKETEKKEVVDSKSVIKEAKEKYILDHKKEYEEIKKALQKFSKRSGGDKMALLALKKIIEEFKIVASRVYSEVKVAKTAKRIKKLSRRLRTNAFVLTKRMRQVAEQAKLDKKLERMSEKKFSQYLTEKSVTPGTAKSKSKSSDKKSPSKKSPGKLPVIHLLSGALPSKVIAIIGKFYSKDFDISEHVIGTPVEKIQEDLAEAEKKRIIGLESKGGSDVAPKDRKFFKQDSKKVKSEFLALKLKLLVQAKEQAKKRSVTPKKGGKLRSWHLNDTGKLPRQLLKKNSVKEGVKSDKKRKSAPDKPNNVQAALQKQWAEDMKVKAGFQPGYIKEYPLGKKQKPKNPEQDTTMRKDNFYKDIAKNPPGYIEINPAGWQEAHSQGRLLYDYFDDLWYLTTDHYHDYFWQIIIPPDFKVNNELKQDLSSVLGKSTDKKSEKSSSKDSEEYSESDFTSSINNCLIDAIYDAANFSGIGVGPPDYRTIRTNLENAGYGDIGTMLYADQRVVEMILNDLGIANAAIILYDDAGQAQDVGGGGDRLIEIYHTGALHYVGYPATQAQLVGQSKYVHKKKEKKKLVEKTKTGDSKTDNGGG